MKTQLTRGLKPETKAQVQSEFKSSAGFRENLVRVLGEANSSLYTSLHSSLNSYTDKDLWALEQVKILAEIEANKKLIDLL